MKLLAAATTLFLITGFTVAEDQDANKPLPRIVRVAGTGEVKVVPDQAMIEVGVERQGNTASAAKQSADAAARAVLASLRANGVDEKDIQTNFLSLQPQVDHRKGNKVTGFVAAQTMTVTIRDLSRVDAVVASLLQAGGNEIDSIQYEKSELKKYRDQARDLAVQEAQQKAEALAKAFGLQLGKVHSIDETSESAPMVYAAFSKLSSANDWGVAQTGPTTAPGQQTISASITVTFDLN